MSTRLHQLADRLLPVRNVNPIVEFGDSNFTYVDISSVDRELRSIRTPQIIPAQDAPSRARQELAQGDVIVSTVRPNLNTVATVGKEHIGAIASTGFCVLRPDQTQLDSRYLFHWVSSDLTVHQLVSQATGATYPAVSDKIIKSTLVDFPPISEQRRIAAILDKVQSISKDRKKAIRLSNQFLTAAFIDMFGEPKTNVKGLPKNSLGEIAKLRNGDFLPSHDMVNTGDVFVYGGNGINGKHDKVMFNEVKLVIGRVGAYCGAVHLTRPGSWITDNALYITELSPHVRLEYLAFALRQANLNQYSSQSGQPLVSASRLYQVEIIVPPLIRQDAFLELHTRTESVLARMDDSLLEINCLSGSLAKSHLN